MPAQKYTLWHHPYSLCSIMVRYTFALAGQPKDSESAMEIEERVVDIFNQGQFDEHYLTKVNKKGQVPALTSPALSQPIADSLEITLYMAEKYPSLMPRTQGPEVRRLLKDLHALNYFFFTFGDKPQMAQSFLKAANERLAKTEISAEYREALEYKLSVIHSQKVEGVQQSTIALNERNAASLVETFTSLLQQGKPWLFGSDRPSALDAHLVVFLARMRDIKRDELIPARLGEYLE